MEKIDKLRNRQLARFLSHLERTGQLTPGLEVDVKRAYRYVFNDIEELIHGLNEENMDGEAD